MAATVISFQDDVLIQLHWCEGLQEAVQRQLVLLRSPKVGVPFTGMEPQVPRPRLLSLPVAASQPLSIGLGGVALSEAALECSGQRAQAALLGWVEVAAPSGALKCQVSRCFSVTPLMSCRQPQLGQVAFPVRCAIELILASLVGWHFHSKRQSLNLNVSPI